MPITHDLKMPLLSAVWMRLNVLLPRETTGNKRLQYFALYVVITMIASRNTQITIAEIERQTRVEAGGLSRMLRELVKFGLIRQMPKKDTDTGHGIYQYEPIDILAAVE